MGGYISTRQRVDACASVFMMRGLDQGMFEYHDDAFEYHEDAFKYHKNSIEYSSNTRSININEVSRVRAREYHKNA